MDYAGETPPTGAWQGDLTDNQYIRRTDFSCLAIFANDALSAAGSIFSRKAYVPPGFSASLEHAVSAVPKLPEILSGCMAATTKISVPAAFTAVHATPRTMPTSLVVQVGS